MDSGDEALKEFDVAESIDTDNEELNWMVELNHLNLRMYLSTGSKLIFETEYLRLKDKIAVEKNPSLYAICCNKIGQLHLREFAIHSKVNSITGGTDYGYTVCNYHKTKAMAHLEEAYDIRKRISDLPGLYGTVGFMSELLKIEGNFDAAFEMSLDAYNFYIRSKSINDQIVELIRMSEISIAQKKLVQSTDIVTRLHQLAKEYGKSSYIERSEKLMGQLPQLL